MSWDAFLCGIKGDIPEEPWDAEELPLGTRGKVLDAIKAQFPGLEQQSNSEFLHTDGDLSIGFRLLGRSPVTWLKPATGSGQQPEPTAAGGRRGHPSEGRHRGQHRPAKHRERHWEAP